MTPEAPDFVRDGGHVEIAGALGEIGHVIMRIAAVADRAVTQLTRILLGIVDQLGHAFDVEILGRRHQERGDIDGIGDGHHVLGVVDLHFRRVDDRRDGIGRHVADHQRVAVRRRVRHVLERDDAERAGLVLHVERLAEALAQLIGENAPDDVGRAARRVGHDDLDRLRRIFVRPPGRRPRRPKDTPATRQEFPGASLSSSNSAGGDCSLVTRLQRAALTPCRLCEAVLNGEEDDVAFGAGLA